MLSALRAALVAATLVFGFSGLALAQSGSAALSGSQAGAQAVVIQQGGAGGSQTIRNTPNVSAPPVYAGVNPCAVGASVGGSVPGFGLSIGETHADHGCELRSWYVNMMQSAQATHDPMYVRWAIGIACAADSTLKAVAPPGVCEPIKVSPAPASVAAVLATPAPVATAVLVPKFRHRTVAEGAPAFCAYPTLAWSAYPACRVPSS